MSTIRALDCRSILGKQPSHPHPLYNIYTLTVLMFPLLLIFSLLTGFNHMLEDVIHVKNVTKKYQNVILMTIFVICLTWFSAILAVVQVIA